MEGFKETVLMEVSKLKVVKERWENLDPIICFKWTEEQEPPFPSHEVEIDMTRQGVVELVELLSDYLKETTPLETKR